MTTPLGNANTLRYDAAEARKSRWFQRTLAASREVALPTASATQLLREQHWPSLTVQVFEEPAFVSPIELPPPRQHRLMLLLSGTMRMNLLSGGRQLTYNSMPGTVKLTMPQHLPYEMQWVPLAAEPIRTAHVYLADGLLARTAEAAGLSATRVELREGSGIADPFLYQLGFALAQELASPAALGGLYAETAAQLMAAHLLRHHCAFTHALPGQRGKLPATRLRHVRDYVRAHLSEAIRLEELAALAHLSPYHFCRVFKRTTGLTPNQFVIRQRLEQAIELLRYSSLNVSEVAAAVGYASPTHFAQLFVRHTGRLPTDYLKERIS